jgi:hypothetical protein
MVPGIPQKSKSTYVVSSRDEKLDIALRVIPKLRRLSLHIELNQHLQHAFDREAQKFIGKSERF